jgi:hypothetical protein
MMLFHAKSLFRPALARRKRSRNTRNDKYRDQKNHCAGKEFLPKTRIHDVPPFLRLFVLKEYFLGVGLNIRDKCKELMLIPGQNCKCFVKDIALRS